ncbi:MAG: PilZ domain-containing protein, partial [Acetobacteraceae bacterium]
MAIERRRSNRLMLTLPLRVRGVDENGDAFDCEAKTIDVSRHGARIRIARPLASGLHVRLTNLLNRREAAFRVAGPVAPLTEKGGDFGIMGP